MLSKLPYVVAIMFVVVPLLLGGWLDKKKNHGKVVARYLGLRGTDGRPSTSKLAAFAWTLALAGGAVFLLLRIALPGHTTLASSKLETLDPIYLLLIGSPLFALIAGKGIVESKINSRQLQKPTPDKAVGRSKGGILKDDLGRVDLLDTQYVLFNLVLLVYFIAMVLSKSQVPALPPTLVGLTSASAAAYVAGKAVASNPPSITAVTKEGADKKTVVVRGLNLLTWIIEPPATKVPSDKVSVAGVGVQEITSWSEDGTTIRLTTTSEPDDRATVAVTTAAGLTVTAQLS